MRGASNANFSYDNAGNLTASPVGYSYTWNAEGRMATAAVSGTTYTYTYNGDGQRVKKAAGSPSSYDKLYWYGLGGEVLAESDLGYNVSSEYIYMGATRIARRDAPSGNIYHFLGDRLGNARIVTNATGVIQEESDMLPYGTERVIPHTPDSGYVANNYKFTGHERDGETAQDHTLLRQYGCNLGRWYSPDSKRGRQSNPQTWNRYAYVSNDPVNSIDPDGAESIECEYPIGEGQTAGYDCRWLFGRRSPNFLPGSRQCMEEPGSAGCQDQDPRLSAYEELLGKFAELMAGAVNELLAGGISEGCAGALGAGSAGAFMESLTNTRYTIGDMGGATYTLDQNGNGNYSYSFGYNNGGNITFNSNINWEDPANTLAFGPNGPITISPLADAAAEAGQSSPLTRTEFLQFAFLHEISHNFSNNEPNMKDIFEQCIQK